MNRVEEKVVLPLPSASLDFWANAMVSTLVRIFTSMGYRANRVLPKDGSETMDGPLPLKSYTMATLPTASDYEGALVYVSDGAAGQKFRGSDGSSWVNLG